MVLKPLRRSFQAPIASKNAVDNKCTGLRDYPNHCSREITEGDSVEAYRKDQVEEEENHESPLWRSLTTVKQRVLYYIPLEYLTQKPAQNR